MKFKKKYCGKNHHLFVGTEIRWGKYNYIWMGETHPSKCIDGRCKKSVLKMEKKIGRLLTRSEIVHHKDLNSLNDRITNLFLFPNSGKHIAFHRILYAYMREQKKADRDKVRLKELKNKLDKFGVK